MAPSCQNDNDGAKDDIWLDCHVYNATIPNQQLNNYVVA